MVGTECWRQDDQALRVERLLWNSILWVQTLYSHNEFSFHDDHLIMIMITSLWSLWSLCCLTLLQNWNLLLDPLAYTRHNQGWQTGRWTLSCPAQEIWWEGQCPLSLTHTFLVSNTQTQAFQRPFSGWWHSRMGHYISCSRDGVGICLQKPRALSILAQVAGDCFASRRHVK